MKAVFDTNILIDYLNGIEAAGVVAMAEGATVLAATEAVATVAAAMENRRASTRESLQG